MSWFFNTNYFMLIQFSFNIIFRDKFITDSYYRNAVACNVKYLSFQYPFLNYRVNMQRRDQMNLDPLPYEKVLKATILYPN